jgi:hypothetical protein
MRLGFGLGVTAFTRNVAAVASVLASVNADGWTAQWANAGTLPAYSTGDTEFAPDTAPILVPLVRKGFDETGTARTDISESVVITRRVRKPWSNGTSDHLTGAGNRVALSSYILASDQVQGVTNNSTETSPKPVALQTDRNRRVVGDTAYCQARGYHWSGRNGKPLAAMRVWFRSTDGTKQTTPALMSGPKVLPGGGNDRFAVIGYDATVNTATWSDGTAIPDGTVIVREMEALPFVGEAIRTTVGETVDARGFTPQSFYKHTARATAPVYAYVNPSTGVDETVTAAGVGSTSGTQKISTNSATAKANPFATPALAIQALRLANTLTGGFTDGCIVQLAPGTYTSPANTTAFTYQSGGELIIETDSTAAAYSAQITGTFTGFRQSWLTYRRIAFVRSSASQIGVTSRLALFDCTLDQGTQTSVFWSCPIYINGLTITGAAAALQSGTNACHVMRGVQVGTSKGTAIGVDAYNVTGCLFFNASWNTAGRSNSNTICDSFANLGVTGTFGPSLNASENVDGYFFANYIVEFASTVSNPIIRISGDGGTANIRHLGDWYRSGGGASLYGRDNDGYDETVGTFRAHSFWSRRGRSMVAQYTKHDWFIGGNAAAGTGGDAARAEAPQHVGGWSVMYEVGSVGNLHQFSTAAGTGPNNGPNGPENPAFFGLRAKHTPSATNAFARLDPKYVGGNNKATNYDGTTVTGATGGVAADYMPAADSPLIGMLRAVDEGLPFDITGAARNRGTAGAYA